MCLCKPNFDITAKYVWSVVTAQGINHFGMTPKHSSYAPEHDLLHFAHCIWLHVSHDTLQLFSECLEYRRQASFCGHSIIHGAQLRIQVFWNMMVCYRESCYRRFEGIFLRGVDKHTPKDIWVTSKKTRVPVTLLRENHVTCNMNLQFYMAMCEVAITLLVQLLSYVGALSVSLPSFLSIFTSVGNWRGIHNYPPASSLHYLRWRFEKI